MKEVSDGINSLAPEINKTETDHNGTSAKWYCGNGTSGAPDATTPCNGKSSSTAYRSLKTGFDSVGSEKLSEKVSAETAKHVSSRMTSSDFTRTEKGVMSSAFAKAHEGAEIVEIRSISTTSVMVNACYDVLAEGLKQLTKKQMHEVKDY